MLVCVVFVFYMCWYQYNIRTKLSKWHHLTSNVLKIACVPCLSQSASAINVAPLHVTTGQGCVTASQESLDDSVISVRWEGPCDQKMSLWTENLPSHSPFSWKKTPIALGVECSENTRHDFSISICIPSLLGQGKGGLMGDTIKVWRKIWVFTKHSGKTKNKTFN